MAKIPPVPQELKGHEQFYKWLHEIRNNVKTTSSVT